MIKSNKKKVNLLLFFAACIFVSIAATKPTNENSFVNNSVSKNDTGKFKNLQVLPKNISEDSLDHLMHGFAASLGVRCSLCHVFNNGKMDFASDEKEEKQIARHMIKMTADINANYFNFENSTRPDTISIVKCFTCHRGSPHPDEAIMPVKEEGKMPPPPPKNQ